MTWTAERRQRQSEAIRQWRPWEKSTGPVSAEGKQKVGKNAFKGGHRARLREIAGLLAEHRRQLNEVMA